MQNKIYIDANILLDLLFSNRDNSKYSTDMLKELADKNVIFVTNNLNLNNVFYTGVEKKKQYKATKDFLQKIHNNTDEARKWEIYNLTTQDREKAFFIWKLKK